MTQTFTRVDITVPWLTRPDGRVRYAECLYDLNVEDRRSTCIPLGYVFEANLKDGTVLSCIFRSSIPEEEIVKVGKLGKTIFISKMYGQTICDTLKKALACKAEGGSSLIGWAAEKTWQSCLTVRNISELPDTAAQIAEFDEDMTCAEYDVIRERIEEVFMRTPFIRGGLVSKNPREFLAEVK